MHILTEFFADAPHVVQVLTLLQLAFTVWMMVDAYQRRVESFWYWVICFFQPVGPWVYLFAVKLRGVRLSGLRTAFTWERQLSLDELRYSVERVPTVANRFALAERLMEKGLYAEAIPLLEAVLAIEPHYCAVLHAMAECQLAANNAEQALPHLEKLNRHDPRWSNYLAWRTLIYVHLARGRPAEALTACRELARRQPTLENGCLLAEYLLHNGKPAEAVQILDEALKEHHFAPWSARWHNRGRARTARRLLIQAEKDAKMKESMETKQG